MGIRTIGRFVYDSATAQAVAAGGNIAFANATIAGGCLSDAGQGVIRIERPGIYNVAFNATLIATSAGAVNVRAYHNGTAIAGAASGETLAAVGDAGAVAFSTPVTVRCCANDAITFAVDAATSCTVATAVVEKVA